MADLPGICLTEKLGILHNDARTVGQGTDDPVVFLAAGGGEVDGQAETVGQGQLFFHRVGAVDVAVVLHVVPIVPGLLDEVAAVGGGIDQHVVGTGLHAALDDGLQELVFHLKILKGKVVNKEQELGDIAKVAFMPKDLDDTLKVLAILSHCENTIAISMSDLGSYTRVMASKFDSPITFASGTDATAPGQIDIETMKALLNMDLNILDE